jgi:hypothetical protein
VSPAIDAVRHLRESVGNDPSKDRAKGCQGACVDDAPGAACAVSMGMDEHGGFHMLAFRAAVAALLLLSASSAYADEFMAVTPSGATEMVFAEPPADVVGKLSAKCIDLGWSVSSSTGTDVTCEAPMNFGQSFVGQLLMGNSYSTPPRRFFRYVVSTVNGVSRVQASGWMELQMAFGQTRRTDFSGAEFHNGAMNFMGAAGGHFPKGTTFPHHAFLGIQLDAVQDGKFTNLRVKSIEPGSAAEQGGMQVGDVITSVAQKRFKNADDLLDASARAARNASYPVEVQRAGKVVKLTVPRVYRPNYDEAVVAIAAAPVAVSIAGQGQPTIADELAKLAKLKADGILNQLEFDQQKAKLLAK